MPVTQSSATALEQNNLLAVLLDFGEPLARIAVIHDSSAGHFDYTVFTVLAKRTALTAFASVGRLYVLLVLKVKQSPEVTVAAQYDMSAATAVSAIRSALGDVLRAVEMQTACTTFARAAVNLNVIYKVCCHDSEFSNQ